MTRASSATAPGAVRVEEHVLHAIVGMQDDENTLAAGRDRLQNAIDERAIFRVERDGRFFFSEYIFEKAIEIAWDFHAKNPTLK